MRSGRAFRKELESFLPKGVETAGKTASDQLHVCQITVPGNDGSGMECHSPVNLKGLRCKKTLIH